MKKARFFHNGWGHLRRNSMWEFAHDFSMIFVRIEENRSGPGLFIVVSWTCSY